MFSAISAGSALIVVVVLLFPFIAGCGRKGPPLPPLVRVPAAPGELTAERRGDTVEIAFTVPSANTDKTRPANIERVEVYGVTTAARMSDADIVRRGERVGSIDVKAPRDPDRTIDADEPASDLEPLEGRGLDQGAVTRVFEELAPSLASPAPERQGGGVEDGRPLLGPNCDVLTRTYIGVGISTRGRRGFFSQQASVPLVPAPAAPSQPAVRYDESGVTVRWTSDAGPSVRSGGAAAGDVVESRPIACDAPTVGYHVYEVGAERFETRLTDKPVDEARFIDRRVEWGVERCYTVRAVHTLNAMPVESEPAPPACEMLADTFPPAPPKGLVAVASEGAINLIWDANTERDLAGYIVLRAPAATRSFTAVTRDPVPDTTFTDTVEAGLPFVYAIQAVDNAGNRGESSPESTPEAAR